MVLWGEMMLGRPRDANVHVTKKHRLVQLIPWGRTSLSRRRGQMPLKEVQEEPLGMCQAGEAARAREPDAGLAPQPGLVLAERLGQVLKSSGSPPLWGQGENLAPRFRMGVTLTKQDSPWDGASSPAGLVSDHAPAGSSCLRPPPSSLLPDGAEASGPDAAHAPRCTGP